MTPVVLASSPLVGPGALNEVADALRSGDRRVSVPPVPFDLDAFTESVRRACRLTVEPPVLVGYSASGPRLFHVASGLKVAGLVFLDARLPADGIAPDADPRFCELLDSLPLADDGTVPSWASWWPAGVIAELVPDTPARERLILGCERPPRQMFSQPIPAPHVDVLSAYVGFGNGYAADAAEAARRGWPVEVIDGADHLWPVTHPVEVARVVADVVDRLAP